MADFTALKTAIQTYIKQNGNEEITGEKLQEILLSVVTTLGDSAINDLVTALANEVAARQNADGTLQQNITNEATARGNADTALGGRIDDEETARANGDTALSNRLGSSITAENTAADQIGAEAEARAAADTALQGLIDGITNNIKNGYVYAGIATPSSTPATGKVFYLALTAGTYTNLGNIEVSQGINILKYNGSAWSLDAFIGIDDELSPGSNNLPKSGNVLGNIIKNGSAFDLSAYNAVDGVLATYADLDAALTALNLLPAVYKQPGMSFRFVLTSDNKYVQYRLMADEFSTDTTQWVINDAGVYVTSPEFIRVYTDSEKRILWAIKADGDIFYGAGVPTQVKDYIQNKISELSLDEYEDIVTFLGNLIEGDTLVTLLNTKVDKATGKSLIDAEYANGILQVYDDNYIDVLTDNEGKCITAIRKDGIIEFYLDVSINNLSLNKVLSKIVNFNSFTLDNAENVEFVKAEIDEKGKLLSYINKKGETYICNLKSESIDNILNTINTQTSNINELSTYINSLKNNLDSTTPKFIEPYVYDKGCSYHDCLGRYINSYRLRQLLLNPYVDMKLSTKDALLNSAGKTFYYDGYVYILKGSNHLIRPIPDSGDPECEYLNLCKVPISGANSSNINNIIAFDKDEIISFEDNTYITCNFAHEGLICVVDDIIHITTLIEYSEGDVQRKYQMVHKKFDLNLNQIGYAERCTLHIDGTTYNFNYDDIPIAGYQSNLVFNSGITKHGNYWYGAFSALMARDTRIIKTTDFVNFIDWYKIPDNYLSYGEVGVMSVDDDYMLLGIRTYIMSIIIKIRVINKSITDILIIKGDSSMLSFFKADNIFYALCTGTESRGYYQIIKLDTRNLRNSYTIMDTNGIQFGPNTWISVDDNNNLYGCVTDVNMKLCKFQLPISTRIECDSILSALL